MIEVSRYTKQLNKATGIYKKSLCLNAIKGRFIGPKVLVNSIPKSGTNLLYELVLLLPLMRGSVTRTLNLGKGEGALCQRISNIRKGQCLPGHISYNESVDEIMMKMNVRHILIIRDFRDVILSCMTYLDGLHVSHPHNHFFTQFKSVDEKLKAHLEGAEEYHITPQAHLIHSFREWLNSKNILIVKYEDLAGSDVRVSEGVIENIVSYLGIQEDINIPAIRKKMFNPNGLTYNAPGVEKWRKTLTASQISLLNSALKKELEYFGYEV